MACTWAPSHVLPIASAAAATLVAMVGEQWLPQFGIHVCDYALMSEQFDHSINIKTEG
jgi:hypothetical protein